MNDPDRVSLSDHHFDPPEAFYSGGMNSMCVKCGLRTKIIMFGDVPKIFYLVGGCWVDVKPNCVDVEPA